MHTEISELLSISKELTAGWFDEQNTFYTAVSKKYKGGPLLSLDEVIKRGGMTEAQADKMLRGKYGNRLRLEKYREMPDFKSISMFHNAGEVIEWMLTYCMTCDVYEVNGKSLKVKESLGSMQHPNVKGFIDEENIRYLSDKEVVKIIKKELATKDLVPAYADILKEWIAKR